MQASRSVLHASLLLICGLVLAAWPAFLAGTASNSSGVIRFVVPYPAGGPFDAAARALSYQVRSSLGTSVVESFPGADGKLNALTMTTAQRSIAMPELHAITKMLPSFDIHTWFAS
jgi:tripartite-type tricarboxylate transporter receptor subunit TctC